MGLFGTKYEINEGATKMPNPENLIGKGFKKGKSGNPKGRPVGIISSKKAIEQFLNTEITWEDIDNKPKKMTTINAMVASQIKKAILHGDTSAFNAVMDRFEGKPKQEIDQNVVVKEMPSIEINGEKMEFEVD